MPIEPIIHNHADEAFRSSIPQLALGRRICIYGHGGKTTLSNALGKLTNLPVIELDAIFWMPHWTQRDKNEMLNIVSQKLNSYSNGWIVDGNYRHVIPHLLPQADTVIWLNMHHIITTLKDRKTHTNQRNKEKSHLRRQLRISTEILKPILHHLVQSTQHQTIATPHRYDSTQHSL